MPRLGGSSFSTDTYYNHSQGIDRRYPYNSPEYPPGALWEAQNMIYLRDSENPEKMRGYARIGSTDMGGTVSGLFDYQDGTRLIATATDGKVYERTAGDFSQASSGSGFNTGTDVRWSGGMFYSGTSTASILVFSNGVDSPKKYTHGAGVAALGGSPPSTGKFFVSWLARAVLSIGDTLYFSRVNDCEQWGVSNGGFEIQIDRGSGDITGLADFAEYLIIFKRNKILVMSPDTSFTVSDATSVSSNIGTAAHATIKEAPSYTGTQLLFMSDQGISGLIPTSATGKFFVRNVSSPIKPVLDRIAKGKMATAWADFNQDRLEYMANYGTTTTAITEGIIANVARGGRFPRWTRHTMKSTTAGTRYRDDEAESQVIGDTYGRVYTLHSGDTRSGGAYKGSVTTQGYPQGAPGHLKTYNRVFTDVTTEKALNVNVKTALGRTDLPAPRSQSITKSFGASDGWGVGEWGVAEFGGSSTAGKWVRLNSMRRGHYIRMMVETTAVNSWFELNGFMTEATLGSSRLA
jgi:hypothetical protein